MSTYRIEDYPWEPSLDDCMWGKDNVPDTAMYNGSRLTIATETFTTVDLQLVQPGWYEATQKIPNWWQTAESEGYGRKFGRSMVLLDRIHQSVAVEYERDDLVGLAIVMFEEKARADKLTPINLIPIYAPLTMIVPAKRPAFHTRLKVQRQIRL